MCREMGRASSKGLGPRNSPRIGIVEDYLHQKQRWRVRLGTGKCHDFKTENLELEEAAEQPPPANWVGPQSFAEMKVQQVAFREVGEEQKVEIPIKKAELAAGSMVVLHSLKSAPELNDQKGEIAPWAGSYEESGNPYDLHRFCIRFV